MLLILLFIYYCIASCFTNLYFDLFLGIGILWFIFARIYSINLPAEKKETFQVVRLLVGLVFWFGLATIGVVAVIFSDIRIGFM